MSHKCDDRCRSESGHHAWPSPRPDECLCSQRVGGEKVWCPRHNGEGFSDKKAILSGPGMIIRCAFCGHEYEEGTPTHKHQSLTDHIRVCPEHPIGIENREMRELLRSIAGLDTNLATIEFFVKKAKDLLVKYEK